MGRALGEPVHYVWASMRGPGGFDQFLHDTLNAHKCDAVIDVPYASENVLATRPYYVSSYVFVFPKKRNYDITSMDSPVLKQLKIGYEADTPAETGLKMRTLILHAVPFDIGDTPAIVAREHSRRSAKRSRGRRGDVGAVDRILLALARRPHGRGRAELARDGRARTVRLPDGDGGAARATRARATRSTRRSARTKPIHAHSANGTACGSTRHRATSSGWCDELSHGSDRIRRRRPDGRQHGAPAQGRGLSDRGGLRCPARGGRRARRRARTAEAADPRRGRGTLRRRSSPS